MSTERPFIPLIVPDDPDDPLRHLHSRVLQGDRRAVEKLAEALLDILPRTIRRPAGLDRDDVLMAVSDAITEYTLQPGRFEPSRGPLASFVRLLAIRNLQDAARKERRRVAREERFAMNAPLVAPPPHLRPLRTSTAWTVRPARSAASGNTWRSGCGWEESAGPLSLLRRWGSPI